MSIKGPAPDLQADARDFFAKLLHDGLTAVRLRLYFSRYGEAVPACGLWHELCDAGGTLWAHGAGIEAALLPDHASEKFYGEAILRRSLFQRPANVVGRGGRSRALRFGWHGLLIDLWMPGRRRGRAHLSARLRAYQGESTGKQRSGRSCHVSPAQI